MSLRYTTFGEFLSLGSLFIHNTFPFLSRMSSEMVACIAVESLSILEKMHAKGFVLELLFLFFFLYWLPKVSFYIYFERRYL